MRGGERATPRERGIRLGEPPRGRCTWARARRGIGRRILRRYSRWTGHAVTPRVLHVNRCAALRSTSLPLPCWAGCSRRWGRVAKIPEEGYNGDYCRARRGHSRARGDVASRISRTTKGCVAGRAIGVDSRSAPSRTRTWREFGVKFDRHLLRVVAVPPDGLLEQTSRISRRGGCTYGAGRARSGCAPRRSATTRDGVLRKSDGTYTYLRARHRLFTARKRRAASFARAIDVLGPTINGYIDAWQAAMQSARLPQGLIYHVVLVQAGAGSCGAGWKVRVFRQRSGRVRHRCANLFQETGVDAARYLFLLMRRGDSQFVFDRGSRQEPDRREPRVLRPDGARADERHLPGGGAGARLGRGRGSWT